MTTINAIEEFYSQEDYEKDLTDWFFWEAVCPDVDADMELILRELWRAGYPMDFLPEDGDRRAMWQFEGGLSDVVIQLTEGTNQRGLPAVFGKISYGDGSCYDLSGSKRTWVAEHARHIY